MDSESKEGVKNNLLAPQKIFLWMALTDNILIINILIYNIYNFYEYLNIL